MREVNPNQIKKDIDLESILKYLFHFAQKPIEQMRHLPDWSWKELIIVQLLLAATSGLLAGILKFNFYRVAFGIIIMPITSTLATLMLSLFFYYYFQFFENKVITFKKLFTFVMLVSIPFYLFQIASEYLSLLTLVGFGFTTLLGIVGLTENFQLNRNKAIQVCAFLFALVTLSWAINLYHS